MIRRAHVLLLAILCSAAAAAQQPRDTPRAANRTASIAGHVFVAGDAKRPARRVRVTLTSVTRSSPGQTATTDDAGAFTFTSVPAGRFELQAFKNAYLRASYGASRPDRTGTPIVVKDGDAIADLAIAIVRGGVITGVVRDGRGRPVPGVDVRVMKLAYDAVTGERTLAGASSFNAAVTDDRGEYRAFGLPPGGYLAMVTPPVGRGNDPIRVLTSDELRQALGGRSGLPPSAAAPSPRVNYAPVFHPGTTEIGSAETVALGLGEERTGVDIAIQLVPTASVSGTITAPGGAMPQFLSVRLIPAGGPVQMLAGAGLRGLTTQPSADGRFVFTGVGPGLYTLRALIGYGRGAPPPNTPTQWATAEISVSGQDLDVPLILQPGVAIAGRAVFEGAVPPSAAEMEQLAFGLVPPGSGMAPRGGGRLDASGQFTFAGVVPDTYRFTTTWNAPAAAEKWTIRSSTANGREAFESPLRVVPNEPINWTVTFTDTPTAIAGVLKDPGGRAATDYYVLVFSTDRSHWTPGSRRVRMTRPATDGSYSVKGLLPGEYFLAAPADLETGEWNDPALLEQLMRSSTKIAVRDGQTTTQNFRVGGG